MSTDLTEGSDEDWETKAENGTIASLVPPTNSCNGSTKDMFGKAKVVQSGKQLGSQEMSSFNDILAAKYSSNIRQKKSDERPETTTVVARRLVAHALQKPELIKKEEETELKQLRDKNKKAREERRKQLDSAWK